MTSDPLEGSILEGIRERYARFESLFSLQADVGDRVNRVLDEEPDKVQVRDGDDRLLSLLVVSLLGKAMKAFQAVQRLCLLGYGEDAVVLLRSNINLLVNLAYIVADPAPNERTKEYVADAWNRYAKFMKGTFGVEVSSDRRILRDQDREPLAQRWSRVPIADRARRLPEHHYHAGYRFYSSIEHSDAVRVFGYLNEGDEEGYPRVDSGLSDSHVEPALMHNADVMVNVLDCCCRYWGINRPDIFEELAQLFRACVVDTRG